MEKRQLVRTFGSALAAATLSFGLFAAPAIAEMSAVANGDAEVYATGSDVKVGEVDLKEANGAVIWVPVDVTSMDDADVPTEAKITFSKDGRRKSQDIEVVAEASGGVVNFYDARNGHTVTGADAIKNLKKAWVKFTIGSLTANDLKAVLKGTWTSDFVTFTSNGEDVVVDVAGAKITANGEAKDAPGFTLEQGSLDLELLTMSSKDDNAYRVNFTSDVKPDTTPKETFDFTTDNGTAEATVVDPSGRKLAVQGNLDNAINGKAGNEDYENGYANGTQKLVFTPLPSKQQGLYALDSLVIKRRVFKNETVAIYNVDSYSAVDDGGYAVTEGLIIPVYRIYNSFDGQHLYTTDVLEAATRVAEGWTDEGIGWYGAADYWNQAVKNPVYRLYNQWSHDHAYTDSETERLAMVADGWTDEGVSFYGVKDGASITVGLTVAESEPVWRLFNQYVTFGTHHYTTSTDEYDALAKVGWTKENIGFNGVKVTKTVA